MVGVFFLLLTSLGGLFDQGRSYFSRTLRVPSFVLPLVCSAIVVLFCLDSYVVSSTVHRLMDGTRWGRLSPLVVFTDTTARTALAPPWVSSCVEVMSVLMSVLLVVLWFVIDESVRRRRDLMWIVGSAVCMTVFSFTLTGISSADLYAYAADAKLGTACYDGGRIFPHGDFYLVHHYWGIPFIPCAYGPVWLVVVHALFGWFSSLGATLIGLRILDAVSIFACALAIRRLGPSLRPFALFCVNPYVYSQFLVDGHNDLFMVALALWSRVCVRAGNSYLAVLLGGFAAGSKLTFFLFVPLAFVDCRSRVERIRLSLCAIGIGAVASLAQPAYFSALRSTLKIYAVQSQVVSMMLHVTLFVSLVSTVAAVCFRYVRWPVAWGFTGVSSIVFSWYLSWSLPYAFLDLETSLPLLASLPLLSFVMSTVYEVSDIWTYLVLFVVIAALLVFVVSLRSFVKYLSERRRVDMLPALKDEDSVFQR